MFVRQHRHNVRSHILRIGVSALTLLVWSAGGQAAEPWFNGFETEAGLPLPGQVALSGLEGRIDNTGADGALLGASVDGTAFATALPFSDGTAVYFVATNNGQAQNVDGAVMYAAYADAGVPDMPPGLDPGGLAKSFALYNSKVVNNPVQTNLFQISTNIASSAAGGDATLEGFFCPLDTTASPVRQVLAMQARVSTFYQSRLMVYLMDGTLRASIIRQSPSATVTISGTTNVTLNSWHHFALTYNVTTGVGTLYLDGAFEADNSATPLVSSAASSTGPFTLAGDWYAGTSPTNAHKWGFNGYTDAYRIYGRILSPTEFLTNGGTSTDQLVWQSDFETEGDVPVTHGQVLSVDAGQIDNEVPSEIQPVAPPNYAAYADAAVPEVPPGLDPAGQAGQFALQNTQQDDLFYIDTGIPSTVAEAITMEGFFYVDAASDTTKRKVLALQARDNRLIAARVQVHLQRDDTLNYDTLHVQVGFPSMFIDGSTEVTKEQWHHFALTYDGHEAALYLDGIPQGTVQHAIGAGTGNMAIGGRGLAGQFEGFVGLMDEIRIYKRILSPAEFLINGGTSSHGLVWRSSFETQKGTNVVHQQVVALSSQAIDNAAPTVAPVVYQAYADASVPDMPGGLDAQGVAGGFAVYNPDLYDFRIDTRVPAVAAPGAVTLEGYLALGSTAMPAGDYVLVTQPADSGTALRAVVGVVRDGAGVKLRGQAFGAAPLSATGNTLLAANQWHHFALVLAPQPGNPAQYDLSLYLDGALQGQALNGVIDTPAANAANFHVGNVAGVMANQAFQPGWLDAVRISAAALTPDAFLMNAGAASTGIWYSSFETEADVAVAHDQVVATAPLAIDNQGMPTLQAYSGTAVNVDDVVRYTPYGDTVAGIPVNIDPQRVSGGYAVLNPNDPAQGNFRINTMLPSNWGHLAEAISMEGFFSLQEDLSALDDPDKDIVARRFVMQKRSDTNWQLGRLMIGLGYSTTLGAPVLGITYYTTGDAQYHHLLGTTPLAMSAWHHFAVTVARNADAGTDDIRFYLDGQEQGQVLGLTDLSPPGSKVITIGDVEQGMSFHGYLDAYRIVDATLTPAQFLNAGVGLTPDLDGSGLVDGADVAIFTACSTGPMVQTIATEPVDCRQADYDNDGDIDLADFARFQRCYGQSGSPVDPACLY